MRRVDIRSDADALKVRDLSRGALFNRNVLPIRNGKIKSGNRGGNIKRNVVLFCENRDLVGTDFVGRVTVSGDTIGTGNDRPHFSSL